MQRYSKEGKRKKYLDLFTERFVCTDNQFVQPTDKINESSPRCPPRDAYKVYTNTTTDKHTNTIDTLIGRYTHKHIGAYMHIHIHKKTTTQSRPQA